MPLCDGDKSVAIEITTHCSLASGLALVETIWMEIFGKQRSVRLNYVNKKQ